MSKKLNKIIAAVFVAMVVAAVGLTTPVRAEPNAEQLALAEKLVTILKANAGFDQIVPALVEDSKTLFIRQNPDLSKDIVEVADGAGEELKKRQPELDKKIVAIYADGFTVEELKAIVAFYETPAGSKLANSVNALTLKSLEAAREWGDGLSSVIVEMIRADMLKRGHKL